MCPQQRLQSQNHVVTSDLLCPHWSFVCSELWPQALGDPSAPPPPDMGQKRGRETSEIRRQVARDSKKCGVTLCYE